MATVYRFVSLVRRVFGSALPRKSGVATDDLTELKRIAAVIQSYNYTLSKDYKRKVGFHP